MTMRVGLYVGADYVAAVALRRRAVVWHESADRPADLSLDVQLATLLATIPRRRFERRVAFVALGPALAQVKLLRGLPPIDAPRVLRQLIEGTPSRFFLDAGDAPVVAEPMRTHDGWWVAVANATTVAIANLACARLGLRDGGVRPVAVLLDRALADSSGAQVTWSDGQVQVHVICGDRGFASIVRTSVSSRESGAVLARLDAPLNELRGDAWRLAGAYAAARAGQASPLVMRRSDDGHRKPQRIARRIVSIAALIVSAAITLVAPGTVAAHVRQQNELAFDSLRGTAALVTRDRAAVEQQQATLRQVRAFAATRRLITPTLSTLSLQLPESTAIVSLRIDTLGGSLVALSPVGTPLVENVSTMPGVEGLQLTAPITREPVGTLELQRVALRFRFKRHASTPVRR